MSGVVDVLFPNNPVIFLRCSSEPKYIPAVRLSEIKTFGTSLISSFVGKCGTNQSFALTVTDKCLIFKLVTRAILVTLLSELSQRLFGGYLLDNI